MNILIVTEVFYPENFLINDFAVEMVQRGHNVSVMTRQPSYPDGIVYNGYRNDDYSVEVWNKITIHRFKTIEGYRTSKVRKVWNYIHFVAAGKRIIGEIIKGVDVILVHQTGPLTLALPAVYARKKWDIPTAIWTFDIWPDAVYAYGFPKIFPLTTFVEHIIRKVYNNVDSIIVSSKQFATTIAEYSANKEIVYAPNWLLPASNDKSDVRLPDGKINFTFTGNVSISQNLDNVIRGFVQANIPDSLLHIVGDGSTIEQHKQLSRELNCNNVVFHGRLPYVQMQDILHQSDYLVLPLISKSGIDKTEPFKIQSYLKSGRPIYGIINGAGREIIEENHIGYCADPDCVDDISLGFRRMVDIPVAEKEDIKKRANALMCDRFNRAKIINRVETILLELKS